VRTEGFKHNRGFIRWGFRLLPMWTVSASRAMDGSPIRGSVFQGERERGSSSSRGKGHGVGNREIDRKDGTRLEPRQRPDRRGEKIWDRILAVFRQLRQHRDGPPRHHGEHDKEEEETLSGGNEEDEACFPLFLLAYHRDGDSTDNTRTSQAPTGGTK
jgi:hypothetical protein